MSEKLDCLVIGAGVVGLAVARALAIAGREVVVVEAESAIGTQNSEVIPAGLYYQPGSLKARLCVRGRSLLYAHAKGYAIPHHRCGKLIVATSEHEIERLQAIESTAVTNDVDDLRRLTSSDVEELEPEVRCVAALLSLASGILDSHAFMLALQGDAESHGAMIALNTPMQSGRVVPSGILVQTGDAVSSELLCRTVVNAAGRPGPSHRKDAAPSRATPAYGQGKLF